MNHKKKKHKINCNLFENLTAPTTVLKRKRSSSKIACHKKVIAPLCVSRRITFVALKVSPNCLCCFVETIRLLIVAPPVVHLGQSTLDPRDIT